MPTGGGFQVAAAVSAGGDCGPQNYDYLPPKKPCPKSWYPNKQDRLQCLADNFNAYMQWLGNAGQSSVGSPCPPGCDMPPPIPLDDGDGGGGGGGGSGVGSTAGGVSSPCQNSSRTTSTGCTAWILNNPRAGSNGYYDGQLLNSQPPNAPSFDSCFVKLGTDPQGRTIYGALDGSGMYWRIES